MHWVEWHKILFLSTPSVRRATAGIQHSLLQHANFYPRPPCGGRRVKITRNYGRSCYFYPRPPCGGRLLSDRQRPIGGDDFYPRPPCGGRPRMSRIWILWRLFLSTPSVRRATGAAVDRHTGRQISIHALRAEGDCSDLVTYIHIAISIHALRAEGDLQLGSQLRHQGLFLSTPSVRRATNVVVVWNLLQNFYPRPPCGGRRS